MERGYYDTMNVIRLIKCVANDIFQQSSFSYTKYIIYISLAKHIQRFFFSHVFLDKPVFGSGLLSLSTSVY